MAVRHKGLTALSSTSQRLGLQTYYQTCRDLGASALWLLDETSGTTMNDASGNARNGTYSGATLNQPPLYGVGGAAAAGGNSGQGIGSITSAPWMNNAAYSVAFFVKIQNTSNQIRGYVSRYQFVPGGWLFWLDSSSKLSFLANNGSDNNLPGLSVAAGLTYFVVGTYGAPTQSLYVISQATEVMSTFSQALSGAGGSITQDIQLGGYAGANYSQATLDGVAYFPSALTLTQVQALYAASKNG